MSPPEVLHFMAMHLFRPSPSLRGPKHDHRPTRQFRSRCTAPGFVLNVVDLQDALLHYLRHTLMHGFRLISLHKVRRIAVAAHQALKLFTRNPCEYRWIRNLVSIQMEDWQNRAIAHRVKEFIRVPGSRKRTRLGFTVADHDRNY